MHTVLASADLSNAALEADAIGTKLMIAYLNDGPLWRTVVTLIRRTMRTLELFHEDGKNRSMCALQKLLLQTEVRYRYWNALMKHSSVF